MGLILIIAALGSGLTGTLGAAHLLFGMGRDGVLPKTVFAYLKPGSNPPTYIILIGLLAFAGAVLLNYFGGTYQHAGELLNFGAFLVMGVNLAVFWQFTVGGKARSQATVAARCRSSAIWLRILWPDLVEPELSCQVGGSCVVRHRGDLYRDKDARLPQCSCDDRFQRIIWRYRSVLLSGKASTFAVLRPSVGLRVCTNGCSGNVRDSTRTLGRPGLLRNQLAGEGFLGRRATPGHSTWRNPVPSSDRS